jgi:acetyl-CoA C-acetyltransferase
MPDAVIVDAVRTPIGRANRGSLAMVRADDLAAVPIRELVARNPAVDFDQTVDVLMGAMSSTGEQGYNIGRTAALLAGLGSHIPACTVDRCCASSLQTLRMASHAIAAGEGEQYIAAGVEAISRAGAGTKMAPEAKNPRLDGSVDSFCDVYVQVGLTAENVASRCAVTREDQDEWALLSQQRAVAARDAGYHAREITPVTVPSHTVIADDGSASVVPESVVDEDDCPRPRTTLKGLSRLPAAFRRDGTVTAGNACPLGDGAAALLVMSDTRARALGLAPLARVVGSAVAALAPEMMGLGPVRAVELVLASAGMTIDDVDIVEINETFAAQIVPCRDRLNIPVEKLNPFGGAIALGHPYGMTGARIAGTLINGLRELDGTYGIGCMCVASGMGQAVLIERLR